MLMPRISTYQKEEVVKLAPVLAPKHLQANEIAVRTSQIELMILMRSQHESSSSWYA